jgi:REP element-mobilizing transposase RayT
MKGEEFLLNEEQKQVVRDSILTASDKWGQEVLALAVCARHIHLVLRKNEKSVEEAAGYYKNAGRVGLGEFGVVGRVWSRGYDKRFCFTEGELVGRVRYVERHLG